MIKELKEIENSGLSNEEMINYLSVKLAFDYYYTQDVKNRKSWDELQSRIRTIKKFITTGYFD